MSDEQSDASRPVVTLVVWLQEQERRRIAHLAPPGDLDTRRQALKGAVNEWAVTLNGDARVLPVPPPDEVNDGRAFVGMKIRLRTIPFVYSPGVRELTFEVHADAKGYIVQPGQAAEQRLPRETPLVDIEDIFAKQVRQWAQALLGG